MIDTMRKGLAHCLCALVLKHVGKHSYIIRPIKIAGGRHIYIGDYCGVMNGARIEAIETYGNMSYNPAIIIGNNVDIGQYAHITAASVLEIGDGTVILPNVLITDIEHKIVDINVRPADQPLEVKQVRIGKNCLIGMGARILPGTSIGDGCIIGTNAVVTHPIPDYSIAVGVPAKIVKQYCFVNRKWEQIS